MPVSEKLTIKQKKFLALARETAKPIGQVMKRAKVSAALFSEWLTQKHFARALLRVRVYFRVHRAHNVDAAAKNASTRPDDPIRMSIEQQAMENTGKKKRRPKAPRHEFVVPDISDARAEELLSKLN